MIRIDDKLNDSQCRAIDTAGSDLLISASAGTGKTKTLTARVVTRLCDTSVKTEIDRMLIVTYTRAAASQMRTKIGEYLTKMLNLYPTLPPDEQSKIDLERIRRSLIRLPSAYVSTIDSFYYDCVKENTEKLGLPADVRVADAGKLDLIALDVMEEVIAKGFRDEPDLYKSVANRCVSYRKLKDLSHVLYEKYLSFQKYVDGIGFLKKEAEKQSACVSFSTMPYPGLFAKYASDRLEYFAGLLETARDFMASNPAYVSRVDAFDTLIAMAGHLRKEFLKEPFDYGKIRDFLLAVPKLPKASNIKPEEKTPEFEAYDKLRAEFSSLLKEYRKYLALPEESQLDILHASGQANDELYRVLSAFEEAFLAEKKRIGLLAFDDFRLFTSKLFVDDKGEPTDFCRQYAQRFDELYIDEYQDVSDVQDIIFRAISACGARRFMVGDIKQSIYGFRDADPKLFAGYRRNFKQGNGGSLIHLTQNYRCAPPVVDSVNEILDVLFSKVDQSIDYDAENDKLRCCKEGNLPFAPTEVHWIYRNADADPEENEYAEAVAIAEHILKLVDGNQYKSDGMPITYGDIVIIYRTNKVAEKIIPILDRYGIPHAGGKKEPYFSNPEVLTVMDILWTVDNPHRDIPLCGTLMSPLFGFTTEELVKIRRLTDRDVSLYDSLGVFAEKYADDLVEGETVGKIRLFLQTLEEYRSAALYRPVWGILQEIYHSPRFIGSGMTVNENLRKLYDRARNFDSGNANSLYAFVGYVTRLIETEKDPDEIAAEKVEGVVNLMTVHHSKGLEGEVVIMAGLGKRILPKAAKTPDEVSDAEFGHYQVPMFADGFGKFKDNVISAAMATHQNIRDMEEAIRVLYVWMTRAQERLLIFGTVNKAREDFEAKCRQIASSAGRYGYLSSTVTFAEWIYAAIFDKEMDKPTAQNTLKVVHHAPNSADSVIPGQSVQKQPDGGVDVASEITANTEGASKTDPSALTDSEEAGDKEDKIEKIRDRIRSTYKYLDLQKIPAKVSVSMLEPEILDDGVKSLDFFKPKKSDVPSFFRSSDGADPAERGTATHLFLQFCNFEKLYTDGVEREFDRLIGEGYLPKDCAEKIRFDELEKFRASELMTRLRSCKKAYRERRFNLSLPAEKFTSDEGRKEIFRGEMLAVQGVIDLVIEDQGGKIALVDYKTDRITEKEKNDTDLLQIKMQEAHAKQLRYYREAVIRMFGKEPDSVEVYSTAAGKCVPILTDSVSFSDDLKGIQ